MLSFGFYPSPERNPHPATCHFLLSFFLRYPFESSFSSTLLPTPPALTPTPPYSLLPFLLLFFLSFFLAEYAETPVGLFRLHLFLYSWLSRRWSFSRCIGFCWGFPRARDDGSFLIEKASLTKKHSAFVFACPFLEVKADIYISLNAIVKILRSRCCCCDHTGVPQHQRLLLRLCPPNRD